MSIFIICLSTSAGDPPQRRALLPQLSSSLQQLQSTISFFSLILRNVMKMVLSDFSLPRKRAHSTPLLDPPTSVIYHPALASKISGNLPQPSPRRGELLQSLCVHSFRFVSNDSLRPGPFTFHNTVRFCSLVFR